MDKRHSHKHSGHAFPRLLYDSGGRKPEYCSRLRLDKHLHTQSSRWDVCPRSWPWPLCLAPLSELHGRRIVYLCSFTLFTIINVGCALSPGIIALSILRILSGICGSAGPTLGGASIGDSSNTKTEEELRHSTHLDPQPGQSLGP